MTDPLRDLIISEIADHDDRELWTIGERADAVLSVIPGAERIAALEAALKEARSWIADEIGDSWKPRGSRILDQIDGVLK
jgi:hypothetical protein